MVKMGVVKMGVVKMGVVKMGVTEKYFLCPIIYHPSPKYEIHLINCHWLEVGGGGHFHSVSHKV